MKNVGFDNDPSESILSQTYISYMGNKRSQGEEQFHSKSCLLEKTFSHAKRSFKSAPRKLNFLRAKPISKSYKVDCSYKCPHTFPHSFG